jgi:hypothetical protein
MSRNNSVVITSRLRAGRLRNQGSIPGKGKRYFPFSITSRPVPGLTQPLTQWVPGAISPGGDAVDA